MTDEKEKKRRIKLSRSETDRANSLLITNYEVEVESSEDSLQEVTDTAFTALKVLEEKDDKKGS